MPSHLAYRPWREAGCIRESVDAQRSNAQTDTQVSTHSNRLTRPAGHSSLPPWGVSLVLCGTVLAVVPCGEFGSHESDKHLRAILHASGSDRRALR
ncbi:MAG TPA: hypothetical protein VNZ26_03035, partial [Vicinamibacterales bacterium]|nr:hypothetical protein [Vicinamibacterales bacterium]